MLTSDSTDGERITVVIYCRVSTDDKDQTNETQERVCREWCESKGWIVDEVYKDEVSGMTLDRKDFNRMLSRIMLRRDIDYIVSYDQSRITRGEDFADLRKNLSEFRCRFRFVRMDLDDSTMAGRIAQDVMTHVNNEENRVRNERTRLGMQTRKLQGKHVGHPAKVIFAEDKETAPDGRYVAGYTLIVTEPQIYSFAEMGYSLNFVASRILEINPHTLEWEMKLRDPSNPNCRNRGTKDRWSIYMTIYRKAIGANKGSSEQRVENTDDSDVQRVVG
ncbi:recombinase family protein [Candidatus Methanoprimaticola sp. MG2]|uniref:recombinase family protein n=1 Tax=Candidatus Methanoprimaticola sp. MG2 TaxID=3228838 RepID=UPI0039C70D98